MILVVAHQSESTRYGLTFPDDFLHVDAEYLVCCWKMSFQPVSQYEEELYANVGWSSGTTTSQWIFERMTLKQRHWLPFFFHEFQADCSTREEVLGIFA